MDQDDREKKETKRPYERPEIVESGRFENLLLSCAFFPNSTPQCDLMPSAS